MNSPHACPGFFAERYSRRRLLQVGGLGMLGLTLPKFVLGETRAPAPGSIVSQPKARARSVIFLYQFGGPSHLDMFDMKPDAPEKIRSPHRPIRSSADGIQVSERLPDVARIMDKVTGS